MASVTSLDKDLRKMRLDKYTPGAAREVREWIEGVLGQRLPPGDLLEALKDGVALCRLVNLAIPPPGVKFKSSAMPFVQMENISHFLRACQQPPLNLQQHDMFLTVDLYESKDPAQVLQCLGAFSRAANAVNPSTFPTAIGRARGVMSPQSTGPPSTGGGAGGVATTPRNRGISNASNGRPALAPSKTGDSAGSGGGGRWSPTKSPTSTSSWSRREHEGTTAPAWNIAQYGYMGGASQGNLGIAFSGRRQITSAGPHVPNAAEKERLRREKEAEEERQLQQMEKEEARRKAELAAEEERARLEEERRWEEETRKARAEAKRRAEEEKRRWEEEERQWRLTEEKRRKEEEEAEARLAEERQRTRSKSDARLRGQFLSQYQAEQGVRPQQPQRTGGDERDEYRDRIWELKKDLEEAQKREAEYEHERQARSSRGDASARNGADAPVSSSSKARVRSRSRPRNTGAASQVPSRQDSWSKDEREYLQTAWNREQKQQQHAPSPLGRPQPSLPPRPLPDPAQVAAPSSSSVSGDAPPLSPGKVRSHRTGESPRPVPPPPQQEQQPVKSHNTDGRPLPDPKAYASRTDQFLASNPAPTKPVAQTTYSRELGDATTERDAEDRRRQQSQQRTKAGGWASKSLLEREMELERQRQREWEEAQKETAKAVRTGDGGIDGIGGGIGGRWDVGQWSGYTGGDSQNKGSQGIGAGRRQIVGPRPLPGGGSGGGR